MHPWLLHHPPITTYGACIVAGLILAWLLARHLARRLALDPSHIDLLVPLLIATGLAGAYSFGLLTDLVTQNSELSTQDSPGTVLLGALLLATAAGILYALLLRIPLGVLGDICAAPVALGIACGRVGCFCAGCCYGRVCPAGSFLPAVSFPQNSFAWNAQLAANLLTPAASASLPVHPVQLYESALCLLLALLLAARLPRRKISGERFLLLGIGYALIRFPLEFLRADNPPVLFSLTFSQVLCILLVILSCTTLVIRRHLAETLHLRVPIIAS